MARDEGARPEPSVSELCTDLIAWAHDRRNAKSGEHPIWRFERWIKEDPELGWATIRQLVERAPLDVEVMYLAAYRVPQLLNRDFHRFREPVLALLRSCPYLDALLGPEVFVEADYVSREIEPECLARIWLRNSRSTDRATWPEELDKGDPSLRLRIAIELIERGPRKGLDTDDLRGELLSVLQEFGDRVIDGIEAAALQSAALRLAIWGNRHHKSGDGSTLRVPSELWARFQAAAGGTNACNTPLPAGEVHRLAPVEEEHVEATIQAMDTFWAWEHLDDLVRKEPEKAWETILAIVRASESAEERQYLGAGPIEDLIRQHPERFIERVEALARHDFGFSEALAAAWITLEDIPGPLARRYYIASGRQLQILDAPEGWNPDEGSA